MKNVFKKLFSFMLVAVMLVSVLPVTAMAAGEDINVKVKFVDGETLLAHATDKIDGYEAETGCEGWNLDANRAAGWLAKEDLFIVDSTVTDATKWKISESYNDGPTRNEKGVWVYTVPMEKVDDGQTPPPATGCEECGAAEGHKDTCSKYECSDCGALINAGEKHADDCDFNVVNGNAIFKYGDTTVKVIPFEGIIMSEGIKSESAKGMFGNHDVYMVGNAESYKIVKEGNKYVCYVELVKIPDSNKNVTITFTFGSKSWTYAGVFKADIDGLTANEAQSYYEKANGYDSDFRVVGSTATRGASDKLYPFDGNTCAVELEETPVASKNFKTVTLLNTDGSVFGTVEVKEGGRVPALKDPAKRDGYKFKGWFDANDYELVEGARIADLNKLSDSYQAEFIKSENDGVSNLYIKVALYSDGKFVDSFKLNDGSFVTMDDGTKILKWLYNDDNYADILKMIKSDSRTKGYQWEDEVFYDRLKDDKLTGQLEKADGDQTIYIRLDATDDIETKVVLYVHSKLSDKTPEDHVLKGYVKGGEIDRDDVWDFIKDKYKTSSKTKMDGLYSKRTWGQKVNGQDPDAVDELTIDRNGYYEVHVILTNASSKADSSNPKTGDNMFMIMTIMTLSATALAGAYIYNKKWMVK